MDSTMRNSLAGQSDVRFMEMALEEARQAAREGEIPVGAVLVREGQVLARDHNRREQERDATAHAEVMVIREACRKLQRWRLSDTTLYVTLEPCPMCAGAIWNARVGRLVYGAWDSAAGACGSQFNLPAHGSLNFRTAVTAGVMEEDCRKILQDFLKVRR